MNDRLRPHWLSVASLSSLCSSRDLKQVLSAGHADESRKADEVVAEGEVFLDGSKLQIYRVTLKDCREAQKWNPDQNKAPPITVHKAMQLARKHLQQNVRDITRYTFNNFKLELLDSEDSDDPDAPNGKDEYWGWIVSFTNNAPRNGTGLPHTLDIIVLMNGYCPPFIESKNTK